MRKNLLKAVLAAAVVAMPGVARADSPNLSGYTIIPTVFYAPMGVTSFDVQFLFGRQGYSSTLFYSDVANPGWNVLLQTSGGYPNQTVSPTPGTVFTGTIVSNSLPREIQFALCSGPLAPSAFNKCTTPFAGPFLTGVGATNVRAMTGAEWNMERASIAPDGATTTFNTVFAFEDKASNGPYYDGDFNDVVFATNLPTVIPEPSTYALMGAGLLGLFAAARRREQTV